MLSLFFFKPDEKKDGPFEMTPIFEEYTGLLKIVICLFQKVMLYSAGLRG